MQCFKPGLLTDRRDVKRNPPVRVQADHRMTLTCVVDRAKRCRKLAGDRAVANHVPGLTTVSRDVANFQSAGTDLRFTHSGYENAVNKIVLDLGKVARFHVAERTEIALLNFSTSRIKPETLAAGAGIRCRHPRRRRDRSSHRGVQRSQTPVGRSHFRSAVSRRRTVAWPAR